MGQLKMAHYNLHGVQQKNSWFRFYYAQRANVRISNISPSKVVVKQTRPGLDWKNLLGPVSTDNPSPCLQD